ncbi:hypothetical protein A7985_07295 [Pseudoalteromonas luteoviolacea]|uniref:Uncharacterized protein n=1 Tax=Pseudoalteromonas luteoviolacea TaxID=43657 RepID=A0A1C0TWR7_9GAMM|nr:hypothetical protein [Pseudoalteromonas luteoviolacea]OCQ23737.1 hypothetical protein A7985_07295 [Pseudoalteromonas luteoviolacea]
MQYFDYVVLVLVYLLYKALNECLKGKLPSAPAAVGRGVGILVLGQFVTLGFMNYLVNRLTTESFQQYSADYVAMLYVPIGIIYALLAGYIAARTYEDTKRMNVKMVAGVGLLPQVLFTVFNFNEGVSSYLVLLLLIPCVLIGGHLNRCSYNKALKVDS